MSIKFNILQHFKRMKYWPPKMQKIAKWKKQKLCIVFKFFNM